MSLNQKKRKESMIYTCKYINGYENFCWELQKRPKLKLY